MQSVSPFPLEQLPQLSARQAALLDLVSLWLADREEWTGASLEEILGQPLLIAAGELRLGRTDPRHGNVSELILLEHVTRGVRALVEVDSPIALQLVWASLTGELDPSRATPRALDRVEQGVLLYLASQVLWSTFGADAPFRVAGLGDEDDLQRCKADGITMYLALRVGPSRGHGWLHLPAELQGAIAASCLTPDAKTMCRRLGTIPTAIHAVFGWTTFTAGQLRRLELGDVLLLDELWGRPTTEGTMSGRVRLRLPLGRPRWTARLDNDGTLEVEGRQEPEAVMTDQADDQLPTDAEAVLDEIPVELSFELGRIPITAHEAIDLRAGQTLRLGRHPGDLVDLRIGPKLVGRGELVLIEGEMGVMLRELHGHQDDET